MRQINTLNNNNFNYEKYSDTSKGLLDFTVQLKEIIQLKQILD